MKNAESMKAMLQAMSDFKTSYNMLLMRIANYESENGVSVNDLPGFTEKYPFDKSFDELLINLWVDNVIEKTKKLSFKVLNYDYFNSGGGCMVGVFEVWLPDRNQVVYALTNEEGCTLASVDYISNDLEIEDYDELMIECVDWGRLTGHEKYFELYRHCLNEYTKSDCAAFKYTRGLPYYLLSDDLQQQLDADYLVWLESEEIDLIETDGKSIIIDDGYKQSVAYDDEGLKQLQDFNEWHTEVPADDCLKCSLYDCDYVVTLRDHTVRIPFNADTWDAVDDLLKRAIADW